MTGLSLDPLSPIEARIARGLRHVDELEEEVERYKRSGRRGPYRIDHVPDGDDWFVGTVRVTRDPSPALGVVAGECVFQFSHALDNLLTAMVRLKDPSPRRHWPSWPYLTDRATWTEKVEREWRGKLTPEHYEIVLREQPFNRDPDASFDEWTVRDLVVWLRDLSNRDKHEAIHVGVVQPRQIGVAQEDSIIGFEWLYEPMTPLRTGLPLYRVKYVDPHVQTTAMVIEPDVTFQVEPDTWIGVGAFRKMGDAVMDLVHEVARTTPGLGHWMGAQ